METTLIILKPDAVQRGLMGKIITRFEEKGLAIVGMKMMTISQDLAGTHYGDHAGKPFYNGLVGFMTSSPVCVLAIRGVGAISIARSNIGIASAGLPCSSSDWPRLAWATAVDGWLSPRPIACSAMASRR